MDNEIKNTVGSAESVRVFGRLSQFLTESFGFFSHNRRISENRQPSV